MLKITSSPLFIGAYPGLTTEWAIVDLAPLRAYQPIVSLGANGAIHDDRVMGLPDSPSLTHLFSVSCPLPTSGQVDIHFDPATQAWTVISANPNVSLSPWNDPHKGLLGFAVGTGTPWMCASRYQDMLILRDGYHRGAAFLSRGIEAVPMLIVNCPTYAHVGGQRPGFLPEPSVLGPMPPTLGDFIDPTITADLDLPPFRRVIRVRPDDFLASA